MAAPRSVRKRPLGNGGLSCFPIGLGCVPLSGVYGATDDASGIRLIHRAFELGVDLLDTAHMYGMGHNEVLVGKALAGGKRKGVIVSTKFGQYYPPKGVPRTDGMPDYVPIIDGRPEHVMQSAEESLRKLSISEIDLFYAHRIDPKVPIEDTVGAMKRLVEQGKVRALGLCEARPETIKRAHGVHPIAAVQMEFSLLFQAEAQEVRQTTRELGIALVAYSPLARSLLTGTVRAGDQLADARGRFPVFAKENIATNLSYVEQMAPIAREKGCTLAQLVLAWLLAQGDDVIPIPGTTKIPRLEENLGAVDVHLTPSEVARLSAIVPAEGAAGERYPREQMSALNH
ncbi:MAG TPA: aldo/keto reductase [Stellaceae bacterium]|nr:aldo/keto reductase [Stellaceae bacterium]